MTEYRGYTIKTHETPVSDVLVWVAERSSKSMPFAGFYFDTEERAKKFIDSTLDPNRTRKFIPR